MKELCKFCGRCVFYGAEVKNKCGNPQSKDYGKFRTPNVVGGCPEFKGELHECDFHRSTLGFGKECSTCEFCKDTHNYKYFCTKCNEGMDGADGCPEWKKKLPQQREFVKICSLQTKEAIEAIINVPRVYYRHGVWNSYDLINTDQVITSINNSGYGADVRFEKIEEMYYVSIPSDGDMY